MKKLLLLLLVAIMPLMAQFPITFINMIDNSELRYFNTEEELEVTVINFSMSVQGDWEYVYYDAEKQQLDIEMVGSTVIRFIGVNGPTECTVDELMEGATEVQTTPYWTSDMENVFTQQANEVEVAQEGTLIQTDNGYVIDKTWRKDLGSPKTLSAYFQAALTAGGYKKDCKIEASLEIGASIFNNEASIIRAEANAHNTTGEASLSFLGQTIWSGSLTTEKTWESGEKELAYETIFMVGPIPVTVRVGVRGSLAITARIRLYGGESGGIGVIATLNPVISLGGFAEAGVTIIVARVTICCDVTFLELSCEFGGGATWNSSQGIVLCVESTGGIQNALAGKISIKVTIKILGKKKTWELKIYEWPGFSFPELFEYYKEWTSEDRKSVV